MELLGRHDRNHDGEIDARELQEYMANYSRKERGTAVDTATLKPGQLTLSSQGPMISPRRESRLAHDYNPRTGVAGTPLQGGKAQMRPQTAFVPRPPPGRKARPGTAVPQSGGSGKLQASPKVPPLPIQKNLPVPSR